MSLIRFAWARICIAIYFSATVLLSSIAVSTLTGSYGTASSFDFLLTGSLLMVLHFILYTIVLNVNREKFLLPAYTVAAVVIVGSILYAGITLSPDYLRSAFHALAALYLIFLYKRERFPIKSRRKGGVRILYYFTIIIWISGLVWVLLFGYHGIILAAPGTENWIIFNLYTSGILLIGLHATLHTRSALLTQVRITPDSLSIDGRDFALLLGKNDLLILSLFVSDPERRMTCAGIVETLSPDHREKNHTSLPDCAVCIREKYKATLCQDYRRVYNQILKIKKFLETMRIGTILPPENKMNVTREGWVLQLFEGTRLHYQPSQTSD